MKNTTPSVPLARTSRVDQVFPMLTPEQITRLAVHGQVRHVQRGEVLMEAGEQTPRFFVVTKSAEKPRRSRRGWRGVGRDGLNAQEPNNTHAVPEPSMGEGAA